MADRDTGHPAKWCIHYRYNRDAHKPEDDTCKAGVRFDTFAGMKVAARPCFLDQFGRRKPGAAPCEHLRRPTAEEIAANELEWERQFNLLGAVLRDIGFGVASLEPDQVSVAIVKAIAKGEITNIIVEY